MGAPVRRPLAFAAALALILVALIVGSAWYLLGEERRLGRLLSLMLTSKMGYPVTVERAWTDGGRIRARNVHLAAAPNFPLEIRIADVEVVGGPLALVAPAGRSVAILASAASVEVRRAGGSGLQTRTLDDARHAVMRALEWPGALTLRVTDGRLVLDAETYQFDLSVEKPGGGTGSASLTVGGASDRSAARLEAHGWVGGPDTLAVHLELAVDPSGFPAVAPSVLATVTSLAARMDLLARPGGEVLASGRASAGVAGAEAVVADFTSRYDARAGELSIAKWVLDWPRRANLEGTASTESAPGGLRVRARAKGLVEGSGVDATIAFQPGSGAFEGTMRADPVDVRGLARRLHLDRQLAGVTVGAIHGRLNGVRGGDAITAAVNVVARGLRVPRAQRPIDATLSVAARSVGLVVERLDSATLTLTSGRARIAAAEARSAPHAMWPLAIDARMDDLAPLSGLLGAELSLAGSVRLLGRLGERAESFDGTVDARIERAQLGPRPGITLFGVRSTLPLVLRGSQLSGTGTVSVDRVEAYALAARDGTASVELRGKDLVLPDLRYAVYGGGGSGRITAALSLREVPLRVHLEGRQVDLATFARDAAVDVARISGRVRYVFDAAYSSSAGLSATARIDSEHGGEVGVDAVRRLVDMPVVQAESTGLLRRTLETLRAFEYESFDAELRMARGVGYVDLSLRGKKRFGIFPGPLEAINVRNMPLGLLVRTFTREGRR